MTMLSMGGLGLAAVPLRARAGSVPKIGILFAGVARRSPTLPGFYERLRELGRVPDQSTQIVLASADGDYARLAPLARELVASRPDVMLCASTPAVIAGMQATRTIPIVMVAVGDPIQQQFATSFAHPDRNVTGPTLLNTALVWKELEALKDLLPKAVTVAAVSNPANPQNGRVLREFEAAASALALQVLPVLAATPEELEAGLKSITRSRPDALMVLPDPFLKAARDRIIEFANRSALPSFFTDAKDVAAGGLLAYGVDVRQEYRRAAEYVDRILRGAKPADLPIQQPSHYELTINAATARRLRLTIPVLLQVRADRIFE
jgi:putative tryptophan/tyrosine transport system substrate-binding protein